MRPGEPAKRSRVGEKVSITPMDDEEQSRRIHAAVARRAFEIFEARGPNSKQMDNWRQAESALLRPLCLGRMSLDHTFWLSTDATPFEEGGINIWVAPKRVTISGKPHPKADEAVPNPVTPYSQDEMMFRVVSLPVEVDPEKVTAKFNGRFLEILLRKAQTNPAHAVAAAA